MTRFARAKGSKSSNERVAEDATDWKDMKSQLEQKNADRSHNDRAGSEKAVKRIQIGSKSEADWADFGNSNANMIAQPKESRKRKKAIIVEDNPTEVQEHDKKKVKRHTGEGKKLSISKDDHSVENPMEQAKSDLGCGPNVFKSKSKLSPKSEHLRKEQKSAANGNNPPPFKRRKPFIESSTIHINGVTINVSKFDGFDVKTDDAQRLKDLRSKMLKEGIPKIEVDKVMKLERRKAEKALAREKKKVCFNCRKAGHLLSECPEVGSFESKNFESSAVNLCYKCGSTEHTYYQCRVQKKDKYSFATCFICKEQGHISSQCPDNPKGLYPQGGCCKVCGEVTHLKKDCPQLSQKKIESAVTLDTLSSGSTLESLGEESEISKGEKKPFIKKQKVVKF